MVPDLKEACFDPGLQWLLRGWFILHRTCQGHALLPASRLCRRHNTLSFARCLAGCDIACCCSANGSLYCCHPRPLYWVQASQPIARPPPSQPQPWPLRWAARLATTQVLSAPSLVLMVALNLQKHASHCLFIQGATIREARAHAVTHCNSADQSLQAL